MLHLEVRLLFSGCRLSFGALRAHTATLTCHVILNLLRLETVAGARLLVLHGNAGRRLVSILDLAACLRAILPDYLLRDVVAARFFRHCRLLVLVVGARLVIVHLVGLQLIVFWLGFVVFHVDHFIAAVILIVLFVVRGHHILEVWILLIHLWLFFKRLISFNFVSICLGLEPRLKVVLANGLVVLDFPHSLLLQTVRCSPFFELRLIVLASTSVSIFFQSIEKRHWLNLNL